MAVKSSSNPKRIRVLLVDDHVVVRIGLRALLEKTGAITVVGEAATVADAIRTARKLKPDVALMDVRLPDGNGAEACRKIRKTLRRTRVLFLTSFSDEQAALEVFLGRADGYLLKEVHGQALIQAITRVARGQPVLDQRVIQPILAKLRAAADASERMGKSGVLSPREQQVIALVAKGKTNKEIAVALDLNDKTVRNYLHDIFQKLQISRRSQAATWFARGSSPEVI